MSFVKAVLLLAVLVAVTSASPILSVTKLHQNDPTWKDEKLDHSTDSIGHFGCTLTAWTMLLNYEIAQLGLKDGGVVIAYTPSDINKLLNDYRHAVPAMGGKPAHTIDGWGIPLDTDGKPTGSTTDLNLGALRKAVEADTKKRSGTGLVMKEFLDSGNQLADGTKVDKDYKPLKDAISAGNPVVVRVNGTDGGKPVKDAHTVLVIGCDDNGDWVILDPFYDPNKPITLLRHKDYDSTIYGYSKGVFKGGGQSSPYEAPSPYVIDPADLLDPAINPDQFGPAYFSPNSRRNAVVPEPGAFGLMAAGLMLVVISGRIRRGG